MHIILFIAKNSNYKESEWKNEKALYEQKIELLEILVKESKIREENLQKMNENLALALNDFAHDTKKFSVTLNILKIFKF